MEAEFDRPWWQHSPGARYKRLTLDGYAGDGVGDDARANNCAKILDGLLRQDLGVAAGSFFSHAVRAAGGMLPQSVIDGIDYVRQQRNDVMHTLGIFRLQDPDRFASCVNAALDAIERAAAARRRGGGAGGGSNAPFARGGGSLASDSGRRAFQLTTAGFVEQQPAGAAARPSGQQQQRQGGEQRGWWQHQPPPLQQQQQQGQQGGRQQHHLPPEPQQERQEQQEQLALLEEGRERQRQQEAARWAAEAAAAEREAVELCAAQEASKQEAEQQQREEAEFEAQLAAALQASLRQQAAAPSERQGLHVPAALQRQDEQQHEQQGRTLLGREVVDLTADSDGPPAKRCRCGEAEAELQGQPGWLEGSPCEIILIGSQ